MKCQFYITEQKALFLKAKDEMFEKVTHRVESRLGGFVEDIKFMQVREYMRMLLCVIRYMRRLCVCVCCLS